MPPVVIETSGSGDLMVVGLVLTLALASLTAAVWLNREAVVGSIRSTKGAPVLAGTVFTVDEISGKNVRRSTRVRKSVLGDEALLSTPKTPRQPRTPVNTASPATAPPVRGAPVTSPGRSPRLTASASKAGKAAPMAATPDSASRRSLRLRSA